MDTPQYYVIYFGVEVEAAPPRQRRILADMAIQRGFISIGIAVRVAALGATLITSIASVKAADTVSGSGVVIGTHGEILTNAHVVENCTQITVRSSLGI